MRTSIAAGVLLVSVCAFAQGGGPAQRQTDWRRYAPQGEDWSVMMPAPPKFERKNSRSNAGGPMVLRSYLADLGTHVYMVMVSEYANENISLDAAMQGIVRAVNGTIVETRNVPFEGYPGRILELKTSEVRMRVRLFVIENRLYQLGYNGTYEVYNREACDYFFDSFRLR